MAYLSVDFPAKTVTGFTPLSFAPPLAAPFQTSVTASFGAIIIPLGFTMLPVPPQTSGGSGGGSVGYPH